MRGPPIHVDQLDRADHEPGLGPERAQQLDVAPPAVTEVEVLPHHDDLGVEAADQVVPHEGLSLLGMCGRASTMTRA